MFFIYKQTNRGVQLEHTLRQTLGWLGGVVPFELSICKRWNRAPEEKIGKKEGQEKQELHKRVWMDIEDGWHLRKHMQAHQSSPLHLM